MERGENGRNIGPGGLATRATMRCNIAWQPSREPWRSGPTVGDFSGVGSSSLKEGCVPRHRSKGRSASSICPRPANLLHQRMTVNQLSDKQEWAGSHPRKPSPISLRGWSLPNGRSTPPSARTIAQPEHQRPSRTWRQAFNPSPEKFDNTDFHSSLNSEESSVLQQPLGAFSMLTGHYTFLAPCLAAVAVLLSRYLDALPVMLCPDVRS